MPSAPVVYETFRILGLENAEKEPVKTGEKGIAGAAEKQPAKNSLAVDVGKTQFQRIIEIQCRTSGSIRFGPEI